jgi:nicotinate-nucleotide pyrophosphorylase (carboxylating)
MFVPNYSHKLVITEPFYANAVLNYFDYSLKMDMVSGDKTTSDLFEYGQASIIAKSDGVMAGGEELALMQRFFTDLSFEFKIADGYMFKKGDVLLIIKASVASILRSERVVLNFLTRFCSIAQKSRIYSNLVTYSFKNKNIKFLSTRKGILGLLDKKAANVGGFYTHRLNLAHAAMYKDNHFAIKNGYQNLMLDKIDGVDFVEFEFDNLQQLQSNITYLDFSLKNRAPFGIMLDNFTLPELNSALSFLNSNFKERNFFVEVSGGVRLDTVNSLDLEGIDYISTSDVFYFERPVDLSLELEIK